MSRRGSGIRSKSLEDRYLNDLANGAQERDDMLHALCRMADQLKRLADMTETATTKGTINE